MVPKCHPTNGASFTTSNDQIYISFTLDRKLLQSFTSGDENSSQLELLLMNKVLTECLGSLTMAYLGPPNKKGEGDTQSSKNRRSCSSPNRHTKRRKLSKTKDLELRSEASSRCESDVDSDLSPLQEESDSLKENMLATVTKNKMVFPIKECLPNSSFASVQDVVSDLAAAAAKDNNNTPLNLSSKFQCNPKVQFPSCDSFVQLPVPPGTPADLTVTSKSEIESINDDKESEDEDCSSKCESPEPQLDNIRLNLNESHSLLSPSLLHENDQLSKPTKSENDNLENIGTAVVTPAAAPSGPVPSHLGMLDDCNNLKYTQSLNDIIMQGFLKDAPKPAKETKTQTDQSTRNFQNATKNAATLGFLNAAHFLSGGNLLTAAQNVSYSNSGPTKPKQANNMTNSNNSNAHQLSSLIASLTATNPASLPSNGNLFSSKPKTSSFSSNGTSSDVANNASPVCNSTTNASSSPTSSISSNNSTSTPRRCQKSLICEYGCGYETPDATLLKSHHVSHSNDRPYQCSYCGHSFKRNHTLLRHIRQVHKIDTTSVNGEPMPILSGVSMVQPHAPICSAASFASSQTHELSLIRDKLKKEFTSPSTPSAKQVAMKQASSILATLSNGSRLTDRDEGEDIEVDVDQKPIDLAFSRNASPKPPSLLHCSEYAMKRSSSPVSLLDLARPQLSSVSNARASDAMNMSFKRSFSPVSLLDLARPQLSSVSNGKASDAMNMSVKRSFSPVSFLDLTRPQLSSVSNAARASDVMNMSLKHHPTPPQASNLGSLNLVMSM